MKNRLIFFFLVMFFAVLPVSKKAFAQDILPPHNSVNEISCLSCHIVNPDLSVQLISQTAEQAQICSTCHRTGGPASGMSDISNHIVNNGQTTIMCSACHNAHGPLLSIDPHTGTEENNLKLIRNKIKNPLNEILSAVFQQSPAHFAFAEGNPPYIGICQTCHSQTEYHRNDGTGTDHEAGTRCTQCHLHVNGFITVSE